MNYDWLAPLCRPFKVLSEWYNYCTQILRKKKCMFWPPTWRSCHVVGNQECFAIFQPIRDWLCLTLDMCISKYYWFIRRPVTVPISYNYRFSTTKGDTQSHNYCSTLLHEVWLIGWLTDWGDLRPVPWCTIISNGNLYNRKLNITSYDSPGQVANCLTPSSVTFFVTVITWSYG